MQADCLENLRAEVALQRGDAHLGGDLEHTLDQRLDHVLFGLGIVNATQHTLANHVGHSLIEQIRVDGRGAVAD